ncbi:hypothetical protein CMO93_04185 [Candidatus Woesearchaeota archaeon]|nr:hypothetical protein [Candidatus Woesearchaeota archaeon]|tara:strand:- start:2425 stop:3009 length:585 start_codon:yes stop_codon:yes gene_type:complete
MVGNIANFRKLDIIRCLLKIDRPVSRSNLSQMLGLGEGTIRSILDILKEKDLLVSDKQGHSLSANGNSVVRKIKNYIEIGKVNLDSIYQGKKNIAIHIKNPKKIEKAVELRDTAVKNGADGALILEYDGQIKFYESIDSDTEHNFNEIENKFDLSKDDMVIVAYADSYMLAEHGALAVAIELCDEIKNIMQGFK